MVDTATEKSLRHGADPHARHRIAVNTRVGNFCGRRLVTRIFRCDVPQCGGVVTKLDQYEVRRGQR